MEIKRGQLLPLLRAGQEPDQVPCVGGRNAMQLAPLARQPLEPSQRCPKHLAITLSPGLQPLIFVYQLFFSFFFFFFFLITRSMYNFFSPGRSLNSRLLLFSLFPTIICSPLLRPFSETFLPPKLYPFFNRDLLLFYHFRLNVRSFWASRGRFLASLGLCFSAGCTPERASQVHLKSGRPRQ